MRYKLIAKRNELGFTQKDMANKLKCSSRQFRRYENEGVDVPFSLAVKWASKLKISLATFKRLYK